MGRQVLHPLNPALALVEYNALGGASTLVPPSARVLAKTATSAPTVLLPAPFTGAAIVVEDADDNADTNAITVDGNGATIDGAATVTLSTAGELASFAYDGVEWHRVGTRLLIQDGTSPNQGVVFLLAGVAGGGGGPDFGAATVVCGAIEVGTPPTASAGQVRLPENGGIVARNSADSADLVLIAKEAGSDHVLIGDPSVLAYIADLTAGASFGFLVGVAYAWVINSSGTGTIEVGYPQTGSNSGASPYGAVDGEGLMAMANANQVAPASVYMYNAINVQSTPQFSAARTLTLPQVTSADRAYVKIIRNTQAGAFGVVVAAAGGGTSITVAQNRAAMVLVTTTGVVRLTADSVFT